MEGKNARGRMKSEAITLPINTWAIPHTHDDLTGRQMQGKSTKDGQPNIDTMLLNSAHCVIKTENDSVSYREQFRFPGG